MLLSSKKNAELGNQSFAAKREVLSASEFLLTKQVGENNNWGPTEIDQRQDALARMAVSVWAYKV